MVLVLRIAPDISGHCPTYLPPSTSVMSVEYGVHTWAMGHSSFWAVAGCTVLPSYGSTVHIDPLDFHRGLLWG